ncbi:MAG: RraA family protein [Verrucomicrobia bacterium]|nr:MAG: RraA family protein [Verrucomicrobiota bacterium]
MNHEISAELLSRLRDLDTCAVCNAIETLRSRLRNEGFMDPSVRCLTPGLRPLFGHAATIRVRCSATPPDAHPYLDRTDWWEFVQTIPAPRVVVVEDVDPAPGLGAFVGEVHAAILGALGCVGAVTNGAVRDVPAITEAGFHLFAGGVSVSHAYVHVVEFGTVATIGGLRIAPADLLHGDGHGIVAVPAGAVAAVPAAAERLRQRELRILALCHSADFTIERLRRLLREPDGTNPGS